MAAEIVADSALAHALNAAIQPKLVEVGWSTISDDSALSEYIILMLVNGKTQDQISSELSGELLNLGEDDPGARDFAQWLFAQINVLKAQQNGGDSAGFQDTGMYQAEGPTGAQDAVMGEMADISDAGENNVPTGPKSMRNGNGNSRPRDKRMLGHLAKAMDRSHDVLHRVRPQNGNERINTHARAAPTGPRQQNSTVRGGPRNVNGRFNNNMTPQQMQQGLAGANMSMTQQQQVELFAMLEQQSKIMAQMLGSQAAMGRGGPMNNNGAMGFNQQQQSSRSLFDRVQNNPRNQNNFQRGLPANRYNGHNANEASPEGPSSSMDVEMSQEKKEMDPENTTCKFNLSCTNKDCPFAHQSTAAPPGTIIDYGDVCSFGAACKNRKCTGKHPSPAQKSVFQTQQDCKFFPNCTNPHCPFKHPTMPLCRNGADCSTVDCKFTHVKTLCRFNPCLNPGCTFKHAEGQKRGKFEDKVWTPGAPKEHVSERKFVDENSGPEELIVPGSEASGLNQASNNSTVVIT